MKFIRFKHNNEEKLGIFDTTEKNIIPISSVLEDRDYKDMNVLIEEITEEEIKLLKRRMKIQRTMILFLLKKWNY